MAKPKQPPKPRQPPPDSAPQRHPDGPMMTLSQEQRARLLAARKAKKWRQQDVAKRVNVSHATISNIEKGRHPQVRQKVYAELVRLFSGNEPDEHVAAQSDALIGAIIDEAAPLNQEDQQLVLNMIQGLKRARSGQSGGH